MMPGGVGYYDNKTFDGFGPDDPVNLHAMELADLEAAFLGNLARYCMAIGTIPRHSLKGFWWVNGECKGLAAIGHDEDEYDVYGYHQGTDYLSPIQPLVDHLIYWSPYILGTEGVEPLLEAGMDTRWYSKKMFPHETGEWLSEEEARRITGRTKKTLWEWRKAGTVRNIKDEHGISYRKEDLELMMEIKRGNMFRGVSLGREPS